MACIKSRGIMMDSCVAGYFEMLLHCAADPDDELLLHAVCWPAETCSQDWLHRACSILTAATAACCSGPTCRFGEHLGQNVTMLQKCYLVTKRVDIQEFEDVDNIKHTLHRTVMAMTLDAWDLYEDKKCIP